MGHIIFVFTRIELPVTVSDCNVVMMSAIDKQQIFFGVHKRSVASRKVLLVCA